MLKNIIESIASVQGVTAVYHDYAPSSAVAPFVVVQLVGGSGQMFIDNQTLGGYERRLQLTVWAQSRTESIQLAQTIERVLTQKARIIAQGAPVADYDSEVDLRGMRQDFLYLS